jgi:hypothetical protein
MSYHLADWGNIAGGATIFVSYSLNGSTCGVGVESQVRARSGNPRRRRSYA